jgi:hypothetical protein
LRQILTLKTFIAKMPFDVISLLDSFGSVSIQGYRQYRFHPIDADID